MATGLNQLQCFQVVDKRPKGLRAGFSELSVVDSSENFEGVLGFDVFFSTGLEEPFDDSFRRILVVLFFDGFDPIYIQGVGIQVGSKCIGSSQQETFEIMFEAEGVDSLQNSSIGVRFIAENFA